MADDKELKAEEQKALPVENKKEDDPSKKLNEQIEALKAELLAKDQLIAELNKLLSEKEIEVLASAKYPVFTVGKKQYELVISNFIHKHKGERIEVDKDVLVQNKELLAELIERGSGALKLKG